MHYTDYTPSYPFNVAQQKGKDHLIQALQDYKYQNWTLNRAKIKAANPQIIPTTPGTKHHTTKMKNTHTVVVYHKRLSESCKNICSTHCIQMPFKGGKTIRDLLVTPKDKDTIFQKSRVICRYTCNRVDLVDRYIGDSARTFAERLKDCFEVPFPINYHYNIRGHATAADSFSILGREDKSLTRSIKEAIFTRVNDPSLTRNIGKYQLPDVSSDITYVTYMVVQNNIRITNYSNICYDQHIGNSIFYYRTWFCLLFQNPSYQIPQVPSWGL